MKYLIIAFLFLLSCAEKQRTPVITLNVQDSSTESSFRGLSVVNDSVAWAGGSNGTVLTTSDYGKNWLNVSNGLPDSVDFRDIEGFSASTAVIMAVGSPGMFFRTSDGGKNWSLTYRDDRPQIFFDAMGFWDEQHGIAFGDAIDGYIEIVRTNDGGATWYRAPEDERPVALEGEGGFAASGTCIITYGDSLVWIGLGAPESRVAFSSNRGKAWSIINSPMAQEAGSAGIFSLAFNTSKFGIAVGGDYMNRSDTTKLIARTSDGGANWNLVENNGLNGQKSAVTPVADSQLWLASGATGVNASFDNGSSWSLIDSTGYYTIQMASKKSGWLTGPSGRIARLNIN